MKLNQFVSMLKEGYSFEVLKTLIHLDLKNPTTEKDKKRFTTLLKGAEKLPAYATAKNQEKVREEIRKYLKNWSLSDLPDGSTLESVIDFSAKTDERIGVTAKDYSAYFDSLIVEEEEEEVGLCMTIYDKDKKKSFKATIHGKSERMKRQEALGEYLPVDLMDMDFVSLRQYLVSVEGSESDSKITVAEAIARGAAYINASTCVGAFVNAKYLDLFKDFF
jgi:DNA-binding ferritin-like protein (Dps family)